MQYYPQQQSSMYNNGGMFPYIPPNPIGNIAPIGFGGYNSGYYTGNYNRYNPYFLQQQRELELAQQREAQRNESSIFKKLYKQSCTYTGRELSDEVLNMFDPLYNEENLDDLSYDEKETYYKMQQEEQYRKYQQQQVINMQGNSQPCISASGYAYANAYYQMNQKAKKEVPDDVGLVDYLSKYAPIKYIEAMEAKQRRAQADLTKMYNKGDYNKLIDMHKKSPLFGNVFNPEVSIDDLEIKLPSYISEKTRQDRRKQFLNAISRGGGI